VKCSRLPASDRHSLLAYVGDIRPRLFGVVNVAAHEASMLGEEQYKRSNPRKHYTQLRPAA
jgi:hypothetical protein